MLKIKDITRDDRGNLRLNAQELKTLCELGVTISDTETTGLKAGVNGLTEFASIRSVKAKGAKPPYRLELLHHFVLPLRPQYQDYVEACADARMNNEPPPPYDRSRYEYEIAPQALAVTGTEFIRETPDGPITGMKVLGKQVDAAPFYEIWSNQAAEIDISRFIQDGKQDVYYNTPFDKPFLRELIKDYQAYQLAASNAHTHEEDENDSPDPVYLQICSDKETEHLSDINYEDANDVERAHILAAIRKKLHTGDALENSSHYQCLMHGFMKAGGSDGPRRLDDAYRALVDPNFDARAEHSAIEDICMAARVACALSGHFDGTVPSMLELYTRLVHRVDPQAIISMAPPRTVGENAGKEGRLIEGDIDIRFSKPISKLSKQGKKTWEFLESFFEVTRRNSRAPEHLLDIHPDEHRLVISADRQSPLSLSFLRKWMLFDQLLDSPQFDGFYPYDSTGTRMDVRLKEKDAATNAPAIIEDVPLSSLRANLKWLHANPALLRPTLEAIRDIRHADERIGTVMVRGTVKDGLRLIIKGHQRQFGDVVMNLPKGQTLTECKHQILEQLPPLIKLGVIPYASSLESANEEEESTAPANPWSGQSKLMIGSRQIDITIPPEVLQLMALQLRAGVIDMAKDRQTITTRSGDKITLEKIDAAHYRFSGSMDAFRDFVLPNTEENVSAAGAVSEKTGNILRDASWMLYRLNQLPGTYKLSVDASGSITLHQPDGVSLDTMNLLYRAKLPFKAYSHHIRIDAAQLMHDAFYWSVHLGRLQEELERDKKRDIEDQRMMPKPFLGSIQHGLFQGAIGALRMDDLQQCWVKDAGTQEDVYHLVDIRDGQRTYHTVDGKLDPISSPISGIQSIEETTRDGQAVAITSPAVYAVWNRWRKEHGLSTFSINLNGTHRVEIPLSDTDSAAQLESIHNVARHLYQLYRLTGIERLPLTDIRQEQEERLVLSLPASGLFEHSSNLLQELIRLYGDLSGGQFNHLSKQVRQHLPDTTNQRPRDASLPLLCDHIERKTDPANKQDGIDHIRSMDAQLTYLLSRLGGAEFQHISESLAYGKQIESDLGTLGFLTHELTRQCAKAAPASDEYHTATQALEQVRTAHEKLFNFFTANERLNEACGVLRKALTGGVEERGMHLIRATAQAKALLTTHHLEQLAGNRFKSLSLLEEAMQPFEASLQRLFVGRDPEINEQDREAISTAYRGILRQLVFAKLKESANPEISAPRNQMTLRYLVKKSGLQWNEAQLQAMIGLYRSSTDAASLNAARTSLSTCFPEQATRGQSSVEMLIIQRQMQADPHFRPASVHEEAGSQTILEEKIAHAFRVRGLHYLRLIATPAEQAGGANTHALRREYEQKARTCLTRGGMDAAEIEKKIASHRTHVRSRAFLRAQEEIMRETALDDSKLDHHLAVIDLDGHEERARTLYLDRSAQLNNRDIERLRQELDDPYALFKHTKSLMAAIHTASEELHDLRMVHYHALRDLAATITLMFQIPSLREAIPDRMADRINTIIGSVAATPEHYGLTHDTMHRVQMAHDGILQDAHRHCIASLNDMQIPYQPVSSNQLSIHIADLARWIDQPIMPEQPLPEAPALASEKPSTILPATPPLARARYAQALHYSTHLLMQLDRDDMDIQLNISRKSNTTPTYCQISLSPNENDLLANLLRELPQTAFGEGCKTTEANGTLSASIPIGKLVCVATLLTMAQKLLPLAGVSDVKLMPSGMGLEGTVTLPKGEKARDQMEGYLQQATFCLAATRKPTLEEMMKGPAGTTKPFQITLDTTLLSHRIPAVETPAHRKSGLLAKAARIGAKIIGIPERERDRFVQGVCSPAQGDSLKALEEKHPEAARHVRDLLKSRHDQDPEAGRKKA